MSRLLVLIYGVVSYLIGVVGLLSIIAVLAGLMPYGYLCGDAISVLPPVLWNIVLVTIWSVIHTGMARPSFKAVLTKLFLNQPSALRMY